MSSKVCRVIAIVMLLSAFAFVAAVVTQTRAEEGDAAAVPEVTQEAKKPTIEQGTEALEKRMKALEKNQNQILAELQQIRQTQDEILQMTQKIFIYMKRR
jgi:prefoldin subunit 5